jgi:nitrite reductase/ring-hydroxylating ferredoxin subunit
MAVKAYKRSIFQRLAGRPQTEPPRDPSCWGFNEGILAIDLDRAPELSEHWGAIAIEDPALPVPVLVFRDGEGIIHAFCNLCGHGGRHLDPVSGTNTLMCCSLGKSTYDYDVQVVGGASEKPVVSFPVREQPGQVAITLYEN